VRIRGPSTTERISPAVLALAGRKLPPPGPGSHLFLAAALAACAVPVMLLLLGVLSLALYMGLFAELWRTLAPARAVQRAWLDRTLVAWRRRI